MSTADPIEAAQRRILVLLDNGSLRADSTRSLRRLAAALGERMGEPVHPVSLLHADKVAAAELDGQAASILRPFLEQRLVSGDRQFAVIPLFFGRSRALTHALPDAAAALRASYGPFQLDIAAPLCPLPGGEPRLADILEENLHAAAARSGVSPQRVLLVDHGSPVPAVTAVRQWLAQALSDRLGPAVAVSEAAMERRPGPTYDFNGEPLEQALARLVSEAPSQPIFLLPLFLAAGRHAGPGGDIERMRVAVEQRHPAAQITQAPLVGSHPKLIEILADRARPSG